MFGQETSGAGRKAERKREITGRREGRGAWGGENKIGGGGGRGGRLIGGKEPSSDDQGMLLKRVSCRGVVFRYEWNKIARKARALKPPYS